jgi:uncharacterized membrane protein
MAEVPAAVGQRFDRLDALRGFTMLWMTAYHFCFDLNHFGYIRQQMLVDPVWTWQRTAILSLFLFTAGLGQAVAWHQGQAWPRFWRRWGQIAGCALLVSAGSYLMYPQTFIYFGVLHGMAVMLVVVRLTAGWGRWLWPLGALAIAMKYIAMYVHGQTGNSYFFRNFDDPWLHGLGWVSRLPVTEDYVPVFPWLGLMWWGMAAGQWVLRHRLQWLQQPLAPSWQKLATLGRWSLSYYMLHQPVLIAALLLWGGLRAAV